MSIIRFEDRSPPFNILDHTNFPRFRLSNNRIHFHSDGTPCVQIPSNITTKFIVLLFFPPIDLQMNARQGCTGGGEGVNCTRTCCRAYSGTEHSLKESVRAQSSLRQSTEETTPSSTYLRQLPAG